VNIRSLTKNDWPQVSQIYEEGIATKNATFEQTPPSWDEWDNSHLKKCRYVIEDNGKIVGWAALSPVSKRMVYQGVSEVSIYIRLTSNGKGYGKKLLNYLIEKSESLGIWTLQAGIFPENVRSIILHEKAGFRTVGIREKIGKMDGLWRDVVLMERRSKIAGL